MGCSSRRTAPSSSRPEEPDGVPDPFPGQGPAVNLAALMSELPAGTRLLVVPVDMPGLPPALLTQLADQPRGGVPRDEVLPAALIIPGQPIQLSGMSLRALWSALDLPAIDFPAASLRNLNTPEDIAMCEAAEQPGT